MTGTWRYAEAARRISGEIRDSFYDVPGDDEELRAAVATMTFEDWLRWRRDAEQDIAAFASATPSARRRRRWKHPAPLLHLAAYQFCLEAAALLEAADLLGPGRGYRETLRDAGRSLARLQDEELRIALSDLEDELLTFLD